MKSQPNRTRRRLNRRLTAVDAGLGTRDKVLVIFKLGLELGRSCVGLHHGTFSGKRILTQFPLQLCNNKSSDSVTATIPQCNGTSPRPTLMVDLKIALLGQCRLFHLPVFKILVKGLVPFWIFWGALLRIFFWPLPGPGPVFVTFRANKTNWWVAIALTTAPSLAPQRPCIY